MGRRGAAGVLAALLLTVWNTILAPLVQWLIATLAPVAVQVFTAVGIAVTGAAGIIADAITLALAVLRGLADFLTAVLRPGASRQCPGTG